MQHRWLRTLACLAALGGVSRPASAFHTIFDYSVDRFEVDGNMFGPADGTPDFVDDFDNASNWYTPYGTSIVIDGRLHVKSPGMHFPGPDGTTLDLTEVVSNYPALQVQKGRGSFTATAVLDPIVPPEAQFYHFTLFTFGGVTFFNEIFGLDIHTLGGETRIEQHLVTLDLGHGIYQTVQTAGYRIAPADVTGQIHFRLVYDDAAGTVVSSFSLDGGATFLSPFAPAPIFTEGRTAAQFLLGADPLVGGATSTSTTTTTTSTGRPTTTSTVPLGGCERTSCKTAASNTLDVRVRTKAQSLVWVWRKGAPVSVADLGDPRGPGGTRYAVCLRDGTGASLLHADVPAGGSCGGRACWRSEDGKRFAYRSGNAGGTLRSLLVTAAGNAGPEVVVTAKGRRLLGRPLPVAMPVTVQLEADTGTCWAATFTARDVLQSGPARLRAATRQRRVSR